MMSHLKLTNDFLMERLGGSFPLNAGIAIPDPAATRGADCTASRFWTIFERCPAVKRDHNQSAPPVLEFVISETFE